MSVCDHRTARPVQVVDWATRGGARALGRDDMLGSVEVGKKADLVLLKNDASPVSFPILNTDYRSDAPRGPVEPV